MLKIFLLQHLHELYKLYLKHPSLKQLLDAGQNLEGGFFLKGLAGSAVAFVLSGYVEQRRRPSLVVVNDKEEAAYLFSDLSCLLPENQVYFFPSSYKRSVQYGQTLPDAIVQRTDVVALLPALNENDERPVVVVTYPDALFEKVVSLDTLSRNSIKIQKG